MMEIIKEDIKNACMVSFLSIVCLYFGAYYYLWGGLDYINFVVIFLMNFMLLILIFRVIENNKEKKK